MNFTTGEANFLLWGIRPSFFQYLAHTGPHRVEGQRQSEDGPFIFKEEETGQTGARQFRGEIDITAHGGLLRISLSDPVLRVDSNGRGTVSFHVPYYEDEVLTLELDRLDDTRWRSMLVAPGTSIFDDAYPAQTPMSDVVVTSWPHDR